MRPPSLMNLCHVGEQKKNGKKTEKSFCNFCQRPGLNLAPPPTHKEFCHSIKMRHFLNTKSLGALIMHQKRGGTCVPVLLTKPSSDCLSEGECFSWWLVFFSWLTSSVMAAFYCIHLNHFKWTLARNADRRAWGLAAVKVDTHSG